MLPLLALAGSAAYAADIEVTSDITTDTTWTADNTYILRKSIFVKDGAQLTIAPGTLILGDNAAGPDNILDNDDDTYGSLVITRSGTINAEGTVDKPITFTAIEERDGINGDPELTLDPAQGDGQFWGGIIILGEAPINNYDGTTNLNEDDIEGFPAGSNSDILYGGPNPNDNSGILKYVSIRFGGFIFDIAEGSEINGLTLGGVGAGTTIENVEIISNSDDGLEIFGGTVNTKRIAVAFCQDDSFDLDQGHQGFHQFWFALQNADSTIGDRAGEWDGGSGSDKTLTPFTNTRIYNATFIGNGSDNLNPNTGIFIDDNFGGQLHNSLIHDFSGPAMDESGDAQETTTATFFNNTWGSFGGGAGVKDTYASTANGNTAVGVNPLLKGISRTTDGGLDPRPLSSSPLLSSAVSNFPGDAPADFFEAANYRGAFSENNNWLRGWSYLHKKGYLSEVEVTSDITADTTWEAGETYVLRKSIFVKNGAELTIEPGALILGDNAPGPDNTLDNDDDTYGSLVITRDGTLNAAGTVEAPINFTAYEEIHGIGGDPLIVLDPSLGDGQFWGGIIILGEAPINNYDGTTNLNEDDIEGFPAGSNADILYGGSSPADNSGTLTYASIRYGGFIFDIAEGSEINGLTLGGVGSGTTIENVEIFSNSDDGLEIFGGTVNTKRIAVAFCQDDSFDLDQGHQGFHQFWFALQNGDSTLGDRAGEWDGGSGSDKTLTPYTNTRIYNATFIGNGSDSVNPNTAIFLDDNFGGQLHNSTIHDFSGPAMDASGDAQETTTATFFNNTWGTFGGGAGVKDTFATVANGNTAINANPNLVSISRSPDKGLDPRPNLASPLLSSSLSSFPVGAPANFFESTSYRGAFGGTNWLRGWSYLDRACYLSDSPDVTFPGESDGGNNGGGTPPFADTDNDGISDALEQSPELAALGFVVGNDDSGLFASSLFSQSTIADLVAPDQVMIQLDDQAGNVILSLPVYSASDLNFTTPLGNMTLTTPQQGDKQFYRLQIPSAN